jgi:ATP-dependent DNA helicase RecG
MTATPIPRTIALTMYGELSLSILDEMPKGRKIIKTWLVPKEKRLNAYEWIKKRNKREGKSGFYCLSFY